MKQKTKKILLTVFAVLMLVSVMSVTAFAAEGDVAGAVEDTWIAARGQIKSVVNKVIFPIIDLVLAVLFFRKGFDCIPRLPQARAVRMDSSGNSSRHPGLLSDLSALHLENSWNVNNTVQTGGASRLSHIF